MSSIVRESSHAAIDILRFIIRNFEKLIHGAIDRIDFRILQI